MWDSQTLIILGLFVLAALYFWKSGNTTASSFTPWWKRRRAAAAGGGGGTSRLTDYQRQQLRSNLGLADNNPRTEYYYKKYGRRPPPGDRQIMMEQLEDATPATTSDQSTGSAGTNESSGGTQQGQDQAAHAADAGDAGTTDDEYGGDPAKQGQTWEEQILKTQVGPDAFANQRKFNEAHYKYSRQPGWPSYVVESDYTPFTGFARWRRVREGPDARQTTSMMHGQYNRPLDYSNVF